MTVRVVTDSACDLPASTLAQHRISLVPLTIRFGEQDFIDQEELSTDEFWARCSASPELPSTAAPSIGQFKQTYLRLAAEGASGIAVVSLSSAQIGRAHV